LKGNWDSDRDPLAALRRGDSALFEAFVRSEAATLIGFFTRLGAEATEAEDLTQEVLLKLYRHAESYEPRQAFGAFAMRIARNAWIDRRRRAGARPQPRSMHGSGTDRPGAGSIESGLEAAGDEPGHELGLSEEVRRLRAALRGLSPNHAMIFELAVVQERPYAEIAEELEIPVGTVKSRVFNALRKLRAAMDAPAESREGSPPDGR
jgi:RNA polymerase sigma-70 factor (ECF subfamily)